MDAKTTRLIRGCRDNPPSFSLFGISADYYGFPFPFRMIFNIIQEMGNVDEMEMLKVFNMGIGMMIVVSEKDVEEVLERLKALGEKAYAIGVIDKKNKKQKSISFV